MSLKLSKLNNDIFYLTALGSVLDILRSIVTEKYFG